MPESERPYFAAGYQLGARITPDFPVFFAVNLSRNRDCVVKFCVEKGFLLNESEEFAERLERESKLLKRWENCPNVARLLDENLSHVPPFIVLERLGESVEESLPDDGWPLEKCLTVLRDVATALHSIHELNDCHGDVKPENILWNPTTNSWTLIDPGSPSLLTHHYADEKVRGWERDILALGRTFVTLYTGLEDTELDEYFIEPLRDEPNGDDFVRLLNRMLRTRSARRAPEFTLPDAETVLRTVKSCLRRKK